MGDLYSRLKQIRNRRGTGAEPGSGAASGAGHEDVPAGSAVPVDAPIRTVLPPGPEWSSVVSDDGTAPGVFLRQVYYPYDAERYGDAFDPDGRWRSLSPLTRRPAGMTPVFLDIETSGLSTGAGSVAFLIGMGVPRGPGTKDTVESPVSAARHAPEAETPDTTTGSSIEVTQFFVSDLGSEEAQIDAVLDHLSGVPDPLYVTYNGGSFDLPVLRSRCVMQRRLFPEYPHLDLLHLVRRLYAPRIGSCTLGAVEARVLHRPRYDDTPGSEAPERFHEFLRTGDYGVVLPVFEHHLRDIAHLAEVALTVNAALAASPADSPVTGRGNTKGSGNTDGRRNVAARGTTDRSGSTERTTAVRGDGGTASVPPLDPDPFGLSRLLLERGGPGETARAVELLEGECALTAERVRRLRAFAARRIGGRGEGGSLSGTGSASVAGGFSAPGPGDASGRSGGDHAGHRARYPARWIRVRELLLTALRRQGDSRRFREVAEELYRELDRRDDLIRLAKVLEHESRDYPTALTEIEGWCDRHQWDPELRHRHQRLLRKRGATPDR